MQQIAGHNFRSLLASAALVTIISQILPLYAQTTGPESSWETFLHSAQMAEKEGRLYSAEDLYRQALKALSRVSHKADDQAACQNGLAHILTLEAKSEEAVRLYRSSVTILKKTYGAKSPKVIETMLDLGSVYEAEGLHPAAMALYNEVLAVSEAHFGPEHSSIAPTLYHLAKAKTGAGKSKDAEADFKRALSLMERQPGQKELDALLSDYVQLLRDLKKDAEAEALEQRRLRLQTANNAKPANSVAATTGDAPVPFQSQWQSQQMSRADTSKSSQTSELQQILDRAGTAPFNDTKLSSVFGTLADVHYGQSRISEAEPLYKNILSIDESTLGPNHPSIGGDLTNLALLYISQGRLAEAEPLLKRAQSIYAANYGPHNLLVFKTESLLGSIYAQKGDLSQAESSYKKALELGKWELGPNSTETASILNNLAYLYFRQGKLSEADTAYKWALASAEGAYGQHDPAVAACLRDYALVLHKLNRHEDAEKLEMRAATILATK